jgi:hypothetical protein
MFVGNMPVLTGDGSGTARIQLALSGTFPTLVGQNDLAEISVPYAGMPAGATAALDVGLYAVSPTDQHISQNQSTVTWSTGWTLPTNSLSAFNIAAGASPAMINFPVPPISENLILACYNESNFVNGNNQAWAYFAYPAYGSALPAPNGPWTNCNPAMWILDPVNQTTYWKYTDTNP